MPTRSLPRPLVVMLVLAIVAAAAVAVYQSWRSTPTAAAPGQDGWVSTRSGPLGPADRDLIVKVRLAGLWEHPVGQEMTDRGVSDSVRDIGAKISAEHLELDRKVIDVARELGVVLPNQPSDQQQQWMSEISSKAGTAYDVTAVNRLRQAHGVVLPLLATVRVSTRNDVVRAFAIDATTYVSRHLGYLESTGLVNFDALAEAPAPARAVVTPAGQYQEVPAALAALGIVLVAAVLIGLVLRMLPRRRPPSTRPPRHVATRAARPPAVSHPPASRLYTSALDPPTARQEADMIRMPR